MESSTAPDAVSVGWVMGEIGRVFDQADAALNQPTEAVASGSESCRTRLHEAANTLEVLNLSGLARVVSELEGLVGDLTAGRDLNHERIREILRATGDGLQRVLQRVAEGGPCQPLTLFALYREMRNLRTFDSAESDLFYPDLHPSLLAIEFPGVEIAAERETQHVREQRSKFQGGLLRYIQGDHAGLDRIRDALHEVLKTQRGQADRGLWWIVEGLVQSLVDGGITPDPHVKRLLGRADLEMRRLYEGSGAAPEPLMRELLYQLAASNSESALVRRIRQTYRIEGVLDYSMDEALADEASAEKVATVHVHISEAQQHWERYVAGEAGALDEFRQSVAKLEQPARDVGLADVSTLSVELSRFAVWLAARSGQTEGVAADNVVNALVLAEVALKNWKAVSSDLVDRLQETIAALAAIRSGERNQQQQVDLGSSMPMLSPDSIGDDLAKAVNQEVEENLKSIEQKLGAAFDDPSVRAGTSKDISLLFAQARGALTVLGVNAAVVELSDCERQAKALLENVAEIDSAQASALAERLMQFPALIESIKSSGRVPVAEAAAETAAPDILAPVALDKIDMSGADEPLLAAEFTLSGGKFSRIGVLEPVAHWTSTDVNSLVGETPEAEPDLAPDLVPDVGATKGEPRIGERRRNVRDGSTAPGAVQALAAMAADPVAAAAIPSATAALSVAASDPSSAPDPAAAQAMSDDDAELREIFLEEAGEVLAHMDKNLKVLASEPSSQFALTEVRRCWHTLKGSGRMADQKSLGDTAWVIERLLNSWLTTSRPVNAALTEVLTQAHSLFSRWRSQIAAGNVTVDPQPLVAAADDLREGKPRLVVSPPTPAAQEPAGLAPQTLIDLRADPLQEIQTPTPMPVSAPAEKSNSIAIGDVTIAIDLYRIFVEEARSRCKDLERCVADLTGESHSPVSEELVRSVHSLAGGAGTTRMQPLSALARALELLLVELAIEQIPVDAGMAALIRKSAAAILAMVEDISRKQFPSPVKALIAELAQGRDEISRYKAVALTQSMPGDTGLVEEPAPMMPADAPAPQPQTPDHVTIGPVSVSIDDFRRFLNEARSRHGDLDRGVSAMNANSEVRVVMTAMARAAHALAVNEVCKRIAPLIASVRGLERLLIELARDDNPLDTTSGTVIGKSVAALGAMMGAIADCRFPDAQDDLVEELKEARAAVEQRKAIAEIMATNAQRQAQWQQPVAAGSSSPPADTEAQTHVDPPDSLAPMPEVTGGSPVFELPELTPVEAAAPAVSDETVRISSPLEQDDPMGQPDAAAPLLPGSSEPVFGALSPQPAEAIAPATEEAAIKNWIAPERDDPFAATFFSMTQRGLSPEPESKAEITLVGSELAHTLSMSGFALAKSHFGRTQNLTPAGTTTLFGAQTTGVIKNPDRRRERLTDELDDELLPIFFEEAASLIPEAERSLRDLRAAPGNRDISTVLMRALHTLKGSARMAGAMVLGQLAHTMESRMETLQTSRVPAGLLLDEIQASFDRFNLLLDQLRNRKTGKPQTEKEQEKQTRKASRKETKESENFETLASRSFDRELAERAVLRVGADVIERLSNQAGELNAARARISGEVRALRGAMAELGENVSRLRAQLHDIELHAETQLAARVSQEAEQLFDPLEFDRFTRFQELTRGIAESVNDVATVQQSLQRAVDSSDEALVLQAQVGRQIQDGLVSVRLVQFSSIADRLHRIVRLTAKDLGKRVSLEFLGGQIEIDRSMLERMTAPLEHLLRNAISHGIESQERRAALGKENFGQIDIELRSEGNEIAIVIKDDGAGLNMEAIRARAIERMLIPADAILSESQLSELIFLPGFSTATQVTLTAGRGVGMDVVKNEVGALGGRIEIVSERDKGSIFDLRLPRTQGLFETLVVEVNSRLFGLPGTIVEHVMNFKADVMSSLYQSRKASWQGRHYPFHYLAHLLGDTAHQAPQQRNSTVIMLRGGADRIALHVDRIIGLQKLVTKNLGPQLDHITGISGASVLPSGKVVLLIDPVRLATRAIIAPLSAAVPGPALKPVATEERRAAAIFVVDDSLTVRKVTSRLLLRSGYDVHTAKDGMDALQQMSDFIPDVMLVDIEMPRMDGFELTKNVRAKEKWRHIPIVMISSRDAGKHREHASALGVNSFLGKPYREQELLDLIQGFLRIKQEAPA